RALGTLGLAVQPLPFLAGALMFDGRYDKHPDDVLGSSSSAVGEPRLLVRGSKELGRSVVLGGQLVLLVPGTVAPSLRPEASTFDASALFTFVPPDSDLAIALDAGYRVDRSGQAIDVRPRLRAGDRLTLNASDFDAIALGLGASKRIHQLEVLGEFTWD